MKKYIVYTVFFFMLTSCFWNNTDVNDNIINDGELSTDGSSNSGDGKNDIPVFDKDLREISFTELGNSFYQNGGNDLYSKITSLSASGETLETKQRATYLESFVGNYKDAIKNREKLCKEDPSLSYCEDINLILTSFLPEDPNGLIIDGVDLYVDGRYFSKLTGVNNLDLENKFVHRVRATKEGYLDYFKKINIDSNSWLQESLSPVLIPSNKQISIDSLEGGKANSDNFSYLISSGSFLDNKGNPYNGEVKLYLFDLGSSELNSNVFNLDAFDDNGSYDGYSMITYGMPLIIPYDTKGNRLSFAKELIGRGKIQGISSIPGIDLVNVPKNTYLGKDELKKYGIPPFWNIDLESGVWHESKMKILDNAGNYEFKYYIF